MSKLCDNKNPLFRDGTSQQQRLIQALLPDYVSVYEKDMSELITFVNGYTELIKYYDINNQENGTWKELFIGQFIDTVNQKTEPHYCLFVAFLELFKFAKKDINTFTKRHLDFYYKDVLKLIKKSANPDQVFVLFELAENASKVLVSANTNLDAKEDALGNPRLYSTQRDVLINKAQAVSFKSVFYNVANDGRLYASPIANSKNGLGEEIEGTEKKWKTFGAIANATAPFNPAQVGRPLANIGFAVASPVLFLAEGTRVVQLIVTLNSTAGLTNAMLNDAFDVSFSGAEDWIVPSDKPKSPQDASYLGSPATNTIIIQRTITKDQEPIVAYNLENDTQPFDKRWPVAKVTLNGNSTQNPFIYQALKGKRINAIKINVDVQDVRNLIVQNDNGVLDASSPFQPFGARPELTSSFYVGSQEAFRKNLKSIQLNLTWKGLPDNVNGFSSYYSSYLPVISDQAKTRSNTNFKAQIDILEGKSWKPLLSWTSSAARLFNTQVFALPYSQVQRLNGNSNLLFRPIYRPIMVTRLTPFRQISIAGNSTLNGYKGDFELNELESYSVNSQCGFIRMQLQNVDFGHGVYQNSYAVRAINQATGKSPGFPLPNEPYTPTLSEFSLNYKASDELNLNNSAANSAEEVYKAKSLDFFHIEPFGIREIHPYLFRETAFASLLPVFNDEGSLYIGISKFTPPGTLSLLFKVAEGSADPNLPVQPVKWSFLSHNEWIELPKNKIIVDGTSGFLTSGIIEFDLPKSMSRDNTVLQSGMVWLKATVTINSNAICEMIQIHSQADLATFNDNENDPNHYASALPAETITSFQNGISGIAKIQQPYASFGGRPIESDDAFYIRVSERLRHKNRAVMIWDYERLVLEEFPEVYKVKCLNHTRFISQENIKEIVPGNVSIVAVANLRNQNAVNLLKPQSSLILLEKVRGFLIQRMTSCVDLYVKNPIYEEIIVKFNVRFHPGVDSGYHSQLLNDEVIRFLSPWAFDTKDIEFGGNIEASVILNFIEKRPYVDYITCFEMDQITPLSTLKNIQVAKAQSVASILTSVPQHTIYVLETDDCECEDNQVIMPNSTADCPCDIAPTLVAASIGVGAGSVGDNFIVGDGTPLGNGGE